MLRIDTDDTVDQLKSTPMSNKNKLEDDLRKWIISEPNAILGEDILLIGREATVENFGDAIDLLGIDRDGNVVIIELKRGALEGTVDFQGLKYAAYTSYWNYDKLRDQFENFRSSPEAEQCYDDERTFTEILEEFCNEDYDLNQDQRIIFVGESVRDRLNFVLRWLINREVDITVVQYQLFTDDGRTYLDVEQVIPLPEHTLMDVFPRPKPWKEDGKGWHLHERTNDETGTLLQEAVDRLSELEILSGPEWTQKLYVSFKEDRKRRVVIRTHRKLLHLDLYDVPAGTTTPKEVSESLDVPENDIVVGDIPFTNNPGVRVTYRSDQKVELYGIAGEARRLLTGDEE